MAAGMAPETHGKQPDTASPVAAVGEDVVLHGGQSDKPFSM